MTNILDTINPVELLAELEHEGEAAAKPAGGRRYIVIKRLLDIIFAAILLLLLSPLMLLVAFLIKITDGGPVLFSQLRAGKDGKAFTMLKFRTMHVGAEEGRASLGHLNELGGPVFKIQHDPRLIRIGKFLRQSSIDELPQLFNVLAGQMSMVGPRPLWLPEAEQAKGAAKLRTKVKPGLTCLWQISGRSELSYEQWVLLDLYYIRQRSTLLDIMIIIQTIPAVLSTHGAY